MNISQLSQRAETTLRKLCAQGRHVGSSGNQAAADFFASTAAAFGFEVKMPAFDCMDWCQQGVSLSAGSESFEAFASPYSSGCSLRRPLIAASTIEELETLDTFDDILLLHGKIARHQLMPKNFPFYNPDEHKHIIHLLETQQPSAIITAPSRDIEMAGSAYPFPLIEDGDFDIPSVYMTEAEGNKLALHVGEEVALESRAQRIPARGSNVITRKGVNPRVVFFAHLDAKMGTPGAIDNAAGVTVLLLLMELLVDYSGKLGIEIVALNGEDYYSNPGEQQYLALNAGRFDEIALGINIDGVGYHNGRVAYSLYDCTSEISGTVQGVFSAGKGFVEGERWYQGDHMLFVMNQRPALALTSEFAQELLAEIIHTSKDTPEIVSYEKLAQTAIALRELIMKSSSARDSAAQP